LPIPVLFLENAIVNHYFIPANRDGFFYVIATQMAEINALHYFHMPRSARMRKDYEPPEYPIFKVGTMQQSIDGNWIASPSIQCGTFRGSIDECRSYLISLPHGAAFDLSKIEKQYI
jgi:hypothetical protein